MEFISPCLKKLKLHKYVGYRRHYYLAAYYPHAIKRILFMIVGLLFFSWLPTYYLVEAAKDSLPFSWVDAFLVFSLYFFALISIPSIIFATQGYRHREEIIASGSGYPSDLPRSSGNETYIAVFLIGITQALNIWYEWW